MERPIDSLVTTLQKLSHEEAVWHLNNHINQLAERLVSNAWKRSWNLMRFVSKNRKAQLGKFKLEQDEYSDMISAVDFNRFYNAILDCVKDCARKNPTNEVMDVTDTIEERMESAKGNLSTDGRSILPFEKI